MEACNKAFKPAAITSGTLKVLHVDLGIRDRLFIVGGATSGFGKAVAHQLLAEGARVLAIARNREKLMELQHTHPHHVQVLDADLTNPDSILQLKNLLAGSRVDGILVNAGGPPAMTALEAGLEEWDAAYKQVLRWKVAFLQALLPNMISQSYGRVVLIESASVKQPMENLVLSNAMRLAVVGYAKTLSQEVAKHGITINILAPGYHATSAMDRLFKKKSDQSGISMEEAMLHYISQTRVGFLGAAEDFASLAVWLLSPHSRYLTGQTISVDGGSTLGVF